MARWLQSVARVHRFASICLLASGCLDLSPINQRPSIAIISDSSTIAHRGDHLMVHAAVDDPEHQVVALSWHVEACVDATDPSTCDPAFFTSTAENPTIDIPVLLDGGAPVTALRVVLEGKDDHGAVAKPSQVLVLPVGDGAPVVMLRKASPHNYLVGTPIDLTALVGDPDDGISTIVVAWKVFTPPSQPTYTLTDITAGLMQPADSRHIAYGQRLIPAGFGDWDVEVTASDPEAFAGPPSVGIRVEHLLFSVVPDHVPCLGFPVSPIVAPPGQALPLYDPTLFHVLVVTDDLDPFPTKSGDALFGNTTFRWSLLRPGSTTRQPLAGVTGNSAAIDPATYTPGDFVELRVEIEDRNHTPITCADNLATCSVIADDACLQRLTWRMEVQ